MRAQGEGAAYVYNFVANNAEIKLVKNPGNLEFYGTLLLLKKKNTTVISFPFLFILTD